MPDLVSLPALRLGGVIETVPFVDRLDRVPPLFARMDALMEAAGLFYAGPQTALYRADGDAMEVRVGIPLDLALPGFEMFEVSATDALQLRHRGPFDGLPAVYDALKAEIEARGVQRGPWARETYVMVARDPALNVVDVAIDILPAPAP